MGRLRCKKKKKNIRKKKKKKLINLINYLRKELRKMFRLRTLNIVLKEILNLANDLIENKKNKKII